MAERRMFAKTIVMSDAFLDMPLSARCLYFTLGMFGDDDGFVNNPKSIMRQIDSTVEDLKTLLENKFLLTFESGVIVIKHWRINNYLRNDRYHETKYTKEKQQLSLEENGAYTLSDGMSTACQPSGIPSIDKDRLEKTSIVENRLDVESGQAASAPNRKRFNKPSIEDILAYCSEAAITIDAQRFFDFYESKGWKVGNSPMKDWKAAVRNWARRDASSNGGQAVPTDTTSGINWDGIGYTHRS